MFFAKYEKYGTLSMHVGLLKVTQITNKLPPKKDHTCFSKNVNVQVLVDVVKAETAITVSTPTT